MKQLLVFIIALSGWALQAQSSDFFEQGNTFYNEGKYEEAIEAYEKILEKGVHSAELYYNLGNAHYKLNHIAPSIFYYEKALQLKPKDKEIQNNANFARNMTIDAIDTVPEVGFKRLFNRVINIFSYNGWAVFAVCCVFIFVLLFLLYRFASMSSRKRVAFVISSTALILALISVFMAFQKKRLDQKDNPGIVFVQETKVNAEPNLRSEEVFRLHEGTKVQVLETLEDWKKIRIADGSTGWIPSEDLKMLSAF
jgi:tetratricopeptide (TPR) repeat protein